MSKSPSRSRGSQDAMRSAVVVQEIAAHPLRKLSVALASAMAIGIPHAALAASTVTAKTGLPAGMTQVATNGATIDVTTTRNASSVTAFNNFHDFTVGSGDTVNLHLPTGAANLVNLVDNQAIVNGTVNSMVGTTTGAGRVFFADANGMVVGATGSINVGALAIVTPGQASMDSLYSESLTGIGGAMTSKLLDGSIDHDAAKVTVNGTINTTSGVRIQAHAIDASGTVFVTGGAAGTGLDAAVNTGGDGTVTVVHDDQGIRLVAQDIDVMQGAQVKAVGSNGKGVADVTLAASAEDSVTSGQANASSSITVNGTLAGKNVTVGATSVASADYQNADDAIAMLGDIGTDAAAKLGIDKLPIGIVASASTAAVTLGGTASIVADGDVVVQAATSAKAATSALNKADGKTLLASAVYGETTSSTTATVQSGANIAAGGNVTVKALHSDELEITAKVSGKNTVGVAAAIGNVSADTNASVASGAVISGNGIAVLAHNSASYGVTSTVEANSTSPAAANAALLFVDTNATATNNASLGTVAKPVGSVTVLADSATSKTEVTTETKVGGDSKDADPKKVVTSQGDTLVPFLESKLGKSESDADDVAAKQNKEQAQPKDADATKGAFRAGVGVSLADVAQGAHASIGDGVVVKTSGDLAVQARVDSAGTKIAATTETESGKDNAADVTASLAIGVSLLHNDASATIGSNADITALHIGVGSDVFVPWDLPNTSDLDKFSNIPEFLKDIYSDLSKSGEPLAASFVSAKSKTADVGLAGAVNFFSLQNDNKAWIGSGAKLNATATTDAAWTGSVALGNDAEGNAIDPAALSFNHAVSVAANTTVQTIDITGNIDLLKVNGTGGTSSDADSVGGGVNIANYADNTIAGIGDGATVTAKGVGVEANDTQQMIVITPSAGRGSGISGNVIFAMATVDNVTHASIANTARITADTVAVTADQGVGVWSIAGAIAQGTSVGVGVGIAINSLDADTKAMIGDNSADAALVDPAMTAAAAKPTAGIVANAVNVQASTDGRSGAIAVSGAQAKGETQQAGTGTGTGGTGTGSTPDPDAAEGIANDDSPGFLKTIQSRSDGSTGGFGIDTILGKLPVVGDLLGKAKTQEGSSAPEEPKQSKPRVAVGVAGSATVDIGNLDTHASIDGITIDRRASSGGSDITVSALNQTDLISASGAGAFATAKTDGKASAGLAGAVAYSFMDNDTTASMGNVVAPHAGDVVVQALSGGSILDLGLGLAYNKNSDEKSASAAGSFSIGTTNNDTSASVTSSTLTATDANSTLRVTAYDHTDIGAGGGAFAIGGSKGVGLAVTWSDIANTNAASIAGGTYAGFGDLSVQALTASRIAAAAIGTAVSSSADSEELSGSFTINQITNSVSAQVTNATIANGKGDVTVEASGTVPVQAYDDLLASHGRSVANFIDFSGASIGDSTPTGSAIFAVSGSIAGGGEAVGVSAAINTISDTYKATLVGGSVDTTGDVAVTATDSTRIIAVSAGIAGSKGEFAGAGSMTANFINDTVSATIGDAAKTTATTVNGATVSANATNAALIDTLAGAVSISIKGSSAGLAVAFDEIGSQTSATIVDTGIKTTGTSTAAGCAGDAAAVSATACSTGTINAAAVGVAGADQVALTASLAVNDIGLEDTGAIGTIAAALRPTYTKAIIDASSIDTTSIGVHASDSSTINTLAGAIAGSKDAAAGAGFALENIGANTSASFTASKVKASGAVNVDAASTGKIDAIAVGGAISGDIAVGGSIVTNLIGNHTEATVDGLAGYGTATRATMKSLDVAATDKAGIDSLAGALSIGLEAGGIGAAATNNTIANITHATLSNSALDVTDTTVVEATSQAAIRTLAAAAAGGEGLGIAGALSVNTIDNDIAATIAGGSQDSAANNTRVKASDDASITSMAGSLGVSAGGGLGAAIAVNDIGTTTTAKIDGATWHAKNVTVAADSSKPGTDANIRTIAAGVGGGSVGGAASAAVNLSTAKVTAAIVGGAQVTAEHNVAVTAANRQGIDVFAGSAGIGIDAAGVGLGAVVNYMHDTTSAYIDGATTHVNALAKDATDTTTVASGKLAHPGNLDTSTIHGASDYVSPDLSEGTVSLSGLAVNASSAQSVTTLGASIAAAFDPVGSAAVSVMANANVLGGTTSAYIQGASINQDGNAGAGTAQTVDVRASSHAYDASFVAGVAAGATDAAASGAVGANAFQRTTSASIQDANVTTRGLANVDAESSQRSVSAVVGLAAALTGGAGTGVINVFDGTTSAAVNHGTLTAGSLDVNATSESQANMIGGAGAFGAAAVSGAFLLSSSHNATSASVGDADGVTNLHVTGDVDVTADSDATLDSAMVSGAGAGGPAVAGMAAVTVIGNTTTATLERTSLNRDNGETGAGSLDVHASETIDVTPDAASAAVSFNTAGIGAAANVVLVQSAVGASIMDSAVRVAGKTDVAATSTRTLDITTLSGGLGAEVGISGALGLAIIGNGPLSGSASGANPLGELDKGGNGTLTSMNSFGGSGLASGSQMGGHLSQADADAVNAATKVGLLDGSHQLIRHLDGTQAAIGNSTVDTGSLDVTATGTTSVTNVVGNIAGGGFLGAGGAVAFSVVDQNVGATIDGTSHVTSNGTVNVRASALNGTAKAYGATLQAESDNYSVASSAYQGAAGFIGLGGAIAISELDNQVSASAGGVIASNNGSAVNVIAQDQAAVASRGGGLVAGGLAGGIVVSQADKHGSTTASIGDSANVQAAGALGVNASATGQVSAKATAVAAGLFAAANGADANARDRESVSATVGTSATLAGNTMAVTANANPDVDAQAFGVAVSGGVSLGASVATAEGDEQVSALIGDSATLQGGNTTIKAVNEALAGGGVSARAVGGAGGLLLGTNASAATAASNATVKAQTGNHVYLPGGNLAVQAINLTSQQASATAGAAGFVGVGASVADANATTTTIASLGTNTYGDTGRTGTVYVDAEGTDTNRSDSTAGSGGVISGNAAVARTSNTANTSATVGDGSAVYGGAMAISATHQSDYAVDVNAVGAGIANMSGAFASTNVTSNVTSGVGANAALYGKGFIDIGATNHFMNVGAAPQVQGGGGGVLSGAAATNGTTLNATTTAKLGDNTTIVSGFDAGMANALASQYDGLVYTVGADPFANPGRILIGADTQIVDSSTVSLDSGGAVAGSGVRNSLTANVTNDVGTGKNDKLLTNGAIGLGSDVQSMTSQSALTHTYGGGAKGDAKASTTINSTQNVTVGDSSMLLAFSQINLTAGIDPAGFAPTVFSADTIAQSYVRGIIAIATGSANTTVHSTANTTVGTGARVLGGADINLGSYRGTATVTAEGAGHGYELGFIPITTTDSNASADGAENLALGGSVTAGIYADNQIDISQGQVLTHAHGAPLLYQYNTAFNPWQYIDAHAAGLNANTDSSGNTGVPVVQGAGQLTAPTGLSPGNSNGDSTATGAVGSGTTGASPGSGSPTDLSVAQILKGTTTSGTTPAYILGSIFASGGNLTVHASNISGAGALTANGSPSVTVNNASAAYLALNDINVSANAGGAITFTGSANAASNTAMGVHNDTSGIAPVVTLDNSYTGSMPYSPNGVTQGPAMLLGGTITNLGGLVDISNATGSVGQFAPISAQQIKEYVPNGAVAVYLPNGTYHSGSDPVASYAPYQINLGDANSAVMYAINAIYNANGQYSTNDALSNQLYNNLGTGALAFTGDGVTRGGVSMIFLGTCLPYANSTCGTNPSPYGGYGFHGQDLPKLWVLPTTKTIAADPTPTSATASGLIAQTIAVKAKFIDIDSAITAGRPTDYTITLDAAAKTFIDGQTGTSGQVDLPTNLWCASSAATCTPGLVKYDLGTKSVVIANVNASGGGFVSLDGGIVSTKALGNITINDGYGHVTLNNALGIPVQLADINTGNNAVGELKITDSFKQYTDASGSWNQTLWYVDTRGVGTQVYTNSNRATDVAHAVAVSPTADASGIYYDPAAGLRYQWEQQVNVHRTITGFNSVSNWGYVDASGVAQSTPTYLLIGSGVVKDTSTTDAFKESITASASYGRIPNTNTATVVDVYYHGCGGSIGSGCHYGFSRTVNSDKDISGNGNGAGVWQYILPTDAQLLLTSSVKADYRVRINFQGNAAGQVLINSNANVLLGGNIYNPSGATTIDATQGLGGSIVAGVHGAITSNGVTLKATGGIGDAGNPLQLVMTGGTLSADAGAQGVNINAATGLSLDHVTAGKTGAWGDVTLNATGDITGGSGVAVSGRDITLNAGGAIGTASQALNIAAHGVTNASHGIDHGVVDVHALNDINLRQVDGDLRVGLIQSDGGSVNVDVPNGSIIDAAGTTSGQALSQDQLDKVRDTLHLTQSDDANGDIAAANRLRIEQTANGNYSQYQGLMANGSVVDGAFVLAAGKIALYRALATAELGHTASDAEVLAYAAARYTTLDAYFTGLLGSGYAATTAFVTPVSNLAYHATDAQVDAITQDAYWKLGWLTSAVNSAAISTSTDAPPPLSFVGSAAPNIKGRNVTLTAQKNIGAPGDVVSISGQALVDGTVTDAQAAALATANAAGDVTIVKDANGNIVSVDVKQTQPLFLTAGGTVTASTQAGQGGSVYLQANGDLNIGTITSDRDVRLAAVGNIRGTGPDTGAPQIVANGNLTMLTGSGSSIGQAADAANQIPERALVYAIGGLLIDATASQDVVLGTKGRDLVFDRIRANGLVVLDAGAGSIVQNLDGLALTGRAVTLRAGGNVGNYAGSYLQLSTGTGTLDGTIGGYARIDSPIAGALHIGHLTAGGNLDVVATGDLTAASVSGAAVNLASGNDATLGTVSTAGDVTLTAVRDLTLGTATGSTMVIEAGRDVIATDQGAGHANATVLSNVTMQLHAGGSIGSPFRISATSVNALADSGNMILDMVSGLQDGDFTATNGSFTLTGSSLHGNTITAGGDVSVTSTGDIAFNTVAGHDVSLDAGTTLALGSVTALGTADLAAGTNASFHQLTSTGNGTLTTGGNLQFDTARIGGDAVVSVGNAADVGFLDVAGTLAATTGGALQGSGVHAGGNASVVAGAGIVLDSLDADQRLDLTATGDVAIHQLTVGGDLAATAGGNTTLGTTTVGHDASLALSGALDGGTFTVGHDLVAAVTGAVVLDTTSVANDARLTVGGDLSSRQLDVGDDLAATVGGNASLVTTNVRNDASLVAAGTLDSGRLDVTHDLTAKVGGKTTLGTTTVGDDASLALSDALDSGTLTVGHDLVAAVTGAVALDTTSVANDARLTVGGDLSSHQLDVGNDLAATVGGNASLVTTNAHNDASLAVTGTLDSGKLDVTHDLTANVGGKTTLGTTTVGDDASLALSDALDSGTLTVGHDLVAGVTGAVVLDTTSVAHDAWLTVGGDLTSNQLDVGHDVTGKLDGNVSLGATTAGNDASLDVADTLDSGTLNVTHDLTATVGGKTTLGTTTVGRDANLTLSGALDSGTLTVGHDLVAGVTGAVALDTTSVANEARLTVGGDLSSHQFDVGNDLAATVGGNASLVTTNARNDASLAVTGTLDSGALDVTRDLAASAGGKTTLGTTTVGNDASLTVGGDLTSNRLDIGHDLTADLGANGKLVTTTVGRDATFNVASQMDLGTLATGRDTLATSGDDLSFARIDAGRDIVLRSLRGRILGGTANAVDHLHADAPGDIVADALMAGLDVTLDSGNDVRVGVLSSGTNTAVDAGHDIVLGTATSRTGTVVSAGNDMQLGTVNVLQGNLQGTAGRDLGVDAYDVSGNVSLAAGRDMRLGSGHNNGTLDLTLGRNLDFGTLSAGGPITIDSSNGSIHGGDLITDVATLGAHDGIVLDTSHIGTRLNLAASDIDVHAVQTTTGKPMTMTLTGYHDGVAKKIVIDLRNADSWMIDRLATVQAVFDTSATKVDMPDATVQGDMLLVTPQARVYMNNVTPKLVMADIQYLEPDTRFQFALDGKAAISDAYVSRYTVGYDVTMPNYVDSHQSTNLDYYGGSVLRYLGSTLTLHTNDEPDHEDVASPVQQAGDRNRDDDLVAPDAAGAVNLGSVN